MLYDPTSQLTINGAVSGSGALSLNGTGTLILAGNSNSFSGGVDVLGATLVLENAGGLPDGSTLTVGDPALFGGTYFMPISPSESSAGASLAPVPEPEAFAILATGGVVLSLERWWHRRKTRRKPARAKRP
jgi:autotransporter-associated beta strand protein